MSDRFDELAKALASGLTRRDALKRFAGGLIGWLLADAALGSKAEAQAAGTCPDYCRSIGIEPGGGNDFGKCVSNCAKCRASGGTECGASGCCVGAETCNAGVCTTNVCTGCVACDVVHSCGASGECGCWVSADAPICFCSSTTGGSCADFQTCVSSADCPGGQTCITTCCPTGICVAGCGSQAPARVNSGMPGTLTR